ncbi:leucine-rich PPR motif-containing protein, mitochondrial-like [Plodia interpunctella]|uniref:leucine-rich PPR motif-containing protein, mitochondrial-like n=1 Tax=Plodia interpunctella TaxID=58824 RepID=UPI0023674492|nr:leucine-rich PPR motif-containing protein, mitochondrial-like [Plodia interpunctella]
MFLTRQCSKIQNCARILASKKFYAAVNVTTIQCPCKHYQIFRSDKTTSINSFGIIFPSSGINIVRYSTVSNESKKSQDLLEKQIAGLSSDIHQKNRVYKNDLKRVMNKVKEMNFSTTRQSLLLISCCGELLPDEAPSTRMALTEEIWNILKAHTTFQVEHYNELLRVYIANKRTLTASSFISQMHPVAPNITTYELILRALGEAGDLNQATEVISNMKAHGFPATESIFHSLIICQGRVGNIKNIQEVLTMMKSLKLEMTIDTHTAVIRALAYNKQPSYMFNELDRARRSGLKFRETHIMEIVKATADIGLYECIPKILQYLPEETLQTPSISAYMQSVCTALVFRNHPIPALEIYKCLPLPSFGPKDDQGLHGRSLVRDCVKASIPSSVLGLVTQELMASGRNPIAIQNASEAALQQGKVPLALDMFVRMKQMGLPLRPHYFWPILLHNSKSYGEKGIMNTLSTMVSMDVMPDYETIMNYTLPYVSFTSPQNLMKKFQEAGLPITTVMTPMMETLLNTGQVRAASEICELFKGKVDADKLLKPLVKGYLISADNVSTVHILQDILAKASVKSKDWVGRFLCTFMQHKKLQEDVSDFKNLVQAISKRRLKISTAAADYCVSRIPDKCNKQLAEILRNELINITDDMIADDGDIFTQQMTHPKHMDEASLRAHLNELEAKGMNTRGVLRKLLQVYCKEGNLHAAKQIADRCQKEGVFLSAGMKAAIFDLHVKLGELEEAEMCLADLNKTAPNFSLDEFKIIDFATLMVYRHKIDQAIDMITEQSKKRHVVGGQSIQMNCWRLLDAMAAQSNPPETGKMFYLLISLGYCKPSNVILGPLIRVHLKNNNLQEAVNEFTNLSAEYNKTPLKHELICAILRAMGAGSEDNFITNERNNGRLNKLVQNVLSVNKQVHGPGDVQLTLIAALADVGYTKTLRKLFLDPTVKFHPDALLRRCERFADEKRVHALENIANAVRDLRRVDVDEIYEMILDVYQRDDNSSAATNLFNRMQEIEVTPSQKFVRNMCALLKANNTPIPTELSMLLQEKKAARERK